MFSAEYVEDGKQSVCRCDVLKHLSRKAEIISILFPSCDFMATNIDDKYILKQWIASKARSDWLVKPRISFASYLPATREKMASRFASVTREEIPEINFGGVYYLTVLVCTKKTIHLSII